jgi:hypothetical protein
MKTSAVFAATALVAVLSLDSASAMRTYLKKFPNGEAAFTQALGHVGTSESLNDFGKMFNKEGKEYTATLCKATFPGTSMTVGEAFGDPCCTWKAGGKADFAVAPFTTPTDKKVCAASAPAASSAAPAASSAAPAASSAAPAASSAAPGATPAASSAKPATAPGPATPAPAATPGKPTNPAAQVQVPLPAPASANGPGKVLPAVIPSAAPAGGNGTKPLVPGPAPAPTPAGSGKGTKATGPTKICT